MEEEATIQIQELIAEHPEGLSVTQISERIDLNRNSTARYCDVLVHQGLLRERRIGPAKLYMPGNDLPYAEQIEPHLPMVIEPSHELLKGVHGLTLLCYTMERRRTRDHFKTHSRRLGFVFTRPPHRGSGRPRLLTR